MDVHDLALPAPGPARSALLYRRTQAEWQASGRTAVAYGSLIWRPGFDYVERLPARVQGFHRSLSMRSRTNRGSPEQPGLVLALLAGGSCRGLVYRSRAQASRCCSSCGSAR
jgi:cation transport protein ChaC